jgi:soluble lytic murein transglycosylase
MNLIYILLVALALISPVLGQSSDAALRRAMRLDNDQRENGQLPTLTAAEHLARAEAYSANRMFPQAREHWKKVIDNYPSDAGVPKAILGTGRSYMWEREYAKAVEWFSQLAPQFSETKEGREGLAFKGASLVRLGRNLEAATAYVAYTEMYPNGERIESAHLNIIDAFREAGRYPDADAWVNKTAARFSGQAAEASALHARLRMNIFRGEWPAAISTAETLLGGKRLAGSMATADEVRYLRAFALEKAGRRSDAAAAFASIPPGGYYGGLAAERAAGGSVKPTVYPPNLNPSDYPVLYRDELVRNARQRKIDPRFLLAIMRQESVFKARAKSPAGARGLLQLVYDTAVKYNKKAGYPNLHPDDLYSPAVNIAIGAEYVADLADEFDGMYEAVAASYNGGEDNAARWLNRSRPKEPGIFASEVGFAETKNYVFKVMNNYRAYRELYDENLNRR